MDKKTGDRLQNTTRTAKDWATLITQNNRW